MQSRKIKGGWGRALALAAAALHLACGGGGGSSDGGGGAQAAGTATSEGPITGFGSVIMNGVRWNTDDAAFEIDGRPGTQADLRVGMIVRVEGRKASDGSCTAERVRFESRLRGPVRGIEELGPDNKALEIFGLRALVSRAETRLRDVTFDTLTEDRIVEISGFANAEGDIEVTHLRDRGVPVVGTSEVKAAGVISGLAGGSFLIGTSEVTFDENTEIDDVGSLGLRDGLEVRVEGRLLANDGIAASEIESLRHRGGDDFDETEIHGIVTEFASLASFKVAGQPVDASRARFEPNDPTLLRNDIRVEAEGEIDAAGVLVAEKIKFKSDQVRIHAEVADPLDVDAVAGTLLLLDIPIHVDSETEIRDRRDDDEGFGLADVEAGDFLEVRGVARADGSVTATRLEREVGDDLELRGPVDMIDAPGRMFTILGVAIRTDAGTEFEIDDDGVTTEAAFYAGLAPGIVVEAKDKRDGDQTNFDVADEVELEEPDLEDDDRGRGGDDDDSDDENGDDADDD